MTPSDLKQDPNTFILNGHENNVAEPKTDEWLSSPSHLSSFFTA